MRSGFLASLAIVATLSAAACATDGPSAGGGGPPPPPPPPTVPVGSATVDAESYGDGYGGAGGFIYSPPNVLLLLDGTVTWTNGTGISHNVTISGMTNPLDAGNTYEQTFSVAGTYPFSCSIHPQMSGSVEVVPP